MTLKSIEINRLRKYTHRPGMPAYLILRIRSRRKAYAQKINMKPIPFKLNSCYLIITKSFIMAKKIKQHSLKSLKKSLLSTIEEKLSDSLTEFPKKINEKKYKRVIHKAGKLLTKSLVINPVKATNDKTEKKSKKKKTETKPENIQTL